MKILFVGDVYGMVGIESLKRNLAKIKIENKIDFTIVNGENITKGKSLSRVDYNLLKPLNIDVFTMGNHAWHGNKLNYLNEVKNIITPANWNPFQKEKGTNIFDCRGLKIRVTNVLGQAFMQTGFTSPYKAIDKILSQDKSDIHIVDFHAEATSEKILFAWSVDGKVNAVIGTHTHVQTADERILPKGTAFITDVGMCGAYNSAIGVDIETVLERAKFGTNLRFKEAKGSPQFSGVIITIDSSSKKTKSIERILIN